MITYDAHVTVDGPAAAPFLVLANSLGTSAALWDQQVPTLVQRYRVVRYEHHGHGGTAAAPGPYTITELGADLLAVLDQVGAERASVAGVSLGGMAAMWLAAHHPERVEGLILACTAPELAPRSGWQQRAAQVRASGTAGLVDGLLARWFSPGFLDARPDVTTSVTEMLALASADGYAGCCDAIGAMDQWADLNRITAPTLIIGGAMDAVCPPELCVRLQQAIAGSSLTILSPAAHLANIEQPERFTAAMVDHLNGTAIERGQATRRSVLGARHVDRSDAASTPFTAPFSEFITRYAWGDIWTRPGLDRRTRSCLTLALLTALGRTDELPLHVRGAKRNGLTDAEIGEVLLHSAVYCGVPAANSAFAVAQRVLDEGDHDD